MLLKSALMIPVISSQSDQISSNDRTIAVVPIAYAMRKVNAGVEFALLGMAIVSIIAYFAFLYTYHYLALSFAWLFSFIQTFTLAIIVILLACRINSFYKGATNIKMIWMHLFNFILFIVVPYVAERVSYYLYDKY